MLRKLKIFLYLDDIEKSKKENGVLKQNFQELEEDVGVYLKMIDSKDRELEEMKEKICNFQNSLESKNKEIEALKIKCVEISREKEEFEEKYVAKISKYETRNKEMKETFYDFEKDNQIPSAKKDILSGISELKEINTLPSLIQNGLTLKIPVKKENLLLDMQNFIATNHPLKKGSFGCVQKVRNKLNNREYAIKTLTSFPKNKDNEDSLSEIQIWNDIEAFPFKPKSIPNFYGFIEEKVGFSGVTYHLFFDYYPQSLKNLIETMKEPLPFKKFLIFTESLINSFAFLQTKNICHMDLKPDNLLLDESNENIYIIDLSVSKQIIFDSPEDTKKNLTVAGSPKYFSPELRAAFKQKIQTTVLNPFKSDVFSLGLLLLELGTLKLPEKYKKQNLEEWDNGIEKLLKEFRKRYREELKNINNGKEKMRNLEKLIKKCLRIESKDRPDFIDLYHIFQKRFRSVGLDCLRTQILIGENKDNL